MIERNLTREIVFVQHREQDEHFEALGHRSDFKLGQEPACALKGFSLLDREVLHGSDEIEPRAVSGSGCTGGVAVVMGLESGRADAMSLAKVEVVGAQRVVAVGNPEQRAEDIDRRKLVCDLAAGRKRGGSSLQLLERVRDLVMLD